MDTDWYFGHSLGFQSHRVHSGPRRLASIPHQGLRKQSRALS